MQFSTGFVGLVQLECGDRRVVQWDSTTSRLRAIDGTHTWNDKGQHGTVAFLNIERVIKEVTAENVDFLNLFRLK